MDFRLEEPDAKSSAAEHLEAHSRWRDGELWSIRQMAPTP
jgi:hypothetical protein